MNCFMGYNPLVAKEVKITTWIKEFDGESPSYPSFPNDGDCFVVFATDEDALTHNALSKKTYTNGGWADAEGGSTPTGTITITENGEGIDVSSYAYADVNVSGGGSSNIPLCTITLIAPASTSHSSSAGWLTLNNGVVVNPTFVEGNNTVVSFYIEEEGDIVLPLLSFKPDAVYTCSNPINVDIENNFPLVIDSTKDSSVTITVTSWGTGT